MEQWLQRTEHEEFSKRMDEANKRLSKRISTVEEHMKNLNDLTLSVRELSITIKNMSEEQKEHYARYEESEKNMAEKIEEIEKRDGDKWRQMTSYIVTILLGGVISYFLMKLGIYS